MKLEPGMTRVSYLLANGYDRGTGDISMIRVILRYDTMSLHGVDFCLSELLPRPS